MLNIEKILKRSWHILWNYRMLWVFGLILALALGGKSTSNSLRYTFNDGHRNQPSSIQAPDGWEGLHGDTFAEKMNDAFRQMHVGILEFQEQYPVEFHMIIVMLIVSFVVFLLFTILTAILRYVSETASIRMVDEYEQSGVKVGFRQGWKYGWSRAAWQVFLVNFIVHLPVLGLFVILGLIGWWIFSAFMGGVESVIIGSLITGIGLTFLFIFITVILMAVLYVLRDFAWRMIVLEDLGVQDSLRKAVALVKRQWRSVGLMWLVMIGLKIVWGIAFAILIFPLLVASLLTALGGVVVAIVPSLLTAGIASLLSAPDYWPWIFAAIIGLPLFFIVAFSPVLLVSGWGQIYQSSIWTLTYRELKALESVAPDVALN
jgi:hypothetical protein